MRYLLCALLALHPPFKSEDAQKIIPELAAALEANYVFPETGNRYAAMLRAKLAAGRYAAFADSGAFAEAVTADLQAVAPDHHLVLVAPRTDAPAGAAPSSVPPNRPPGIGKAEWIAPRVAYIEFNGFPSDKPTLEKLQTFIHDHARARTLIIDMTHQNYGGWIGEADLLFSHLFSKPADLLAIDMRKSVHDRVGGLSAPSIREVASPASVVRYIHSVKPAADPLLKNANVYVLIGNQTISAGEHIAFALQRAHRATLIGEPTKGAGNVESDFPMPGGYTVVIPFARAYDPRTGEGWEGVGVRPDIAVPADKALGEALKLTRAPATTGRSTSPAASAPASPRR